MKIKAARLVAAKKVTRSTQERLPPVSRRPLLVIDGDSFAHRAYHALPKTILRRGRKQAGAIVGFAYMLLRLHREEEPRAVLVAWDTLEVPTYRHEEFSEYQSAREFDDALVEQLHVLPEFVAAPLRETGGRSPAIPICRNHEPKGPIAKPPQTKSDLE